MEQALRPVLGSRIAAVSGMCVDVVVGPAEPALVRSRVAHGERHEHQRRARRRRCLLLDCLDRIYLNAYVNKLQTEGQVAHFLR